VEMSQVKVLEKPLNISGLSTVLEAAGFKLAPPKN
jgi:hypothetical protein